MVSKINSPQKTRLIVLLPESLAGNLEFAQMIHRMAVKDKKDVLYLTLLDNNDNPLGVSRQVATMKAITESNLIRARSVQIPASHWFGKLQDIFRPGDIVVCHEEQVVKQGFLKTIPISDFLSSAMRMSIITVNNYYHPQRIQIKSWLLTILFWVGALVILAGFSLLEVQANMAFPGSVNKLVLAALLIVEFSMVWAWNQIIHR